MPSSQPVATPDVESRKVQINLDLAVPLPPPERVGRSAPTLTRRWSARLEPFESYSQAGPDLEASYKKFAIYYRANFLPRIPPDRATRIAVLSCGPGLLVKTLLDAGYAHVVGIDASPIYIDQAVAHHLPCRVADPVDFLDEHRGEFDLIISEQELNHLTLDETIDFLTHCRSCLAPGGGVLVYAINGGNPLTSPEHLSHNIDHFYSVTEYSLRQILEVAGFTDVRPFACNLYVFWKNPFNYLGLAVTFTFETTVRLLLRFYGKNLHILSKRIGAVATTTAETNDPA